MVDGYFISKFGDEISIDLVWLDGKAVLHIVDTATRFSSATFIDAYGLDYGQSVEGIRLPFRETWCTLYTGYPNRMRADQISVFTSDRWKSLTDLTGIQPRLSGVEEHSSLGIEERLHYPPRRIYKIYNWNIPTLPKSFVSKLQVKQ